MKHALLLEGCPLPVVEPRPEEVLGEIGGGGDSHERMDALGFGLENYDAIGAWRESDGKFPVDASGTLPGGQRFQGPGELKAILLREREAFTRNLAEKVLTFALGRGLEYHDRRAVEGVTRVAMADGFRMRTLIREVVRAAPFQMRKAPARAD